MTEAGEEIDGSRDEPCGGLAEEGKGVAEKRDGDES